LISISVIKKKISLFLYVAKTVLYLQVALPIIHSFSRETLLYLQPTTSRKWQWGATEIVQIVVCCVQCCQLLQNTIECKWK